jgi:dTDP-4-amino-4,6-dideoxygalactose transaminase
MKPIPFLQPNITDEDISACVSSIKSGWLAYGECTTKAEKLLADFLEVDNFLMTSSCTASLQMALMLSNVGVGDEVITTPLSWVATSNVIIHSGAKVVFSDVDAETGLLDIPKLLKNITANTKAIIVVDLYGLMFDVERLRKELPRQDIVIIEDAAHSFGSTHNGLSPGASADFACFSFHVAKNLTSGQGGGLICKKKSDYENARLMRRDGVSGANQHRTMISLGNKFDGTDFQSALLINQIKRYKETSKLRKKVYQNYENLLANNYEIGFQKRDSNFDHSGHMFVIWMRDSNLRDNFFTWLEKKEIQVSVHYNPIHLEPYYAKTFGFKRGDFPVAESIGLSAVSLPTYPSLTEVDQNYIVTTIHHFFDAKT